MVRNKNIFYIIFINHWFLSYSMVGNSNLFYINFIKHWFASRINPIFDG